MKIAFLGAGKMGSALAGGLVRSGMASAEEVTGHARSDVSQESFLRAVPGGRWESDVNEAVAGADVVVLGVKPAQMDNLIRSLKPGRADPLWITVAAGLKLSFYEERLGPMARIIRAMPNTPSVLGEGVTAYVGGKNVREEDVAWTNRFFSAVGLSIPVEEEWMEAVTAVSGSGPAYFYRIIGAMARAGTEEGLPADLALRLAAQTARGAAEMVLRGGATPEELVAQVASKGGTTEAALTRLDVLGLNGVMAEAVRAAAARARDLSQS
jgi:pyrroline-5-carboxylate reductase